MVYLKKAIQAMSKAIEKVWSFATKMAFITVIASFVFFALAIAMPDNFMKATEIAMGLLKEVGIVGTG